MKNRYYGDGENVTHYLGNDDYEAGTNLPDQNRYDRETNPRLTGAEAEGNEAIYEDDDEG